MSELIAQVLASLNNPEKLKYVRMMRAIQDAKRVSDATGLPVLTAKQKPVEKENDRKN